MDVLLHTGFHKTGSSSIQETLARLDQPGLVYLQRSPANHSLMIRSGYSDVAAGEPPHPARQMFRSLLQRAANRPDARSLIISGEGTVQLDQGGLERLRDDIREVTDSLRVIGRGSAGVRLFNVADQEHVVSAVRLADDGSDDGDAAEPGDAGAEPEAPDGGTVH